jgi:hypothetical protein
VVGREGGGKAAHVGTNLGQQHLGDTAADPGDGVEELDLGLALVQPRRDFGAVTGDRLIEIVDVAQVLGEEEAVVRTHAAGERLDQLVALGPQATLGERSQTLGVGLAGQQRLQHGPRGLAHDVGRHARQLEVRVLEHLVQPVHEPPALLDQRAARARQVPQLALRGRGHAAAAHQAMPEQVGDPLRVAHVGLASLGVPEALA